MKKVYKFSSEDRCSPRLARPGIAAVFASLAAASALHAASATWSASPTDANWVTNSSENNWSTGVGTYPGSISILTNTDTATFTGPSSQLAITLSVQLDIGSITFSGSSEPAYTIGSTTGNSVLLTSGGQIGTTSTVTGGSITNAVNAPLVLEPASGTTAGTYTFQSSSATASHVLAIGGAVSGGTTSQGITLTLTGANAGSSSFLNTVNGNITNGAAALGVAVLKTSSGTWNLTGTNGFTGGLAVTGGELDVIADTNLGGAGGSVTINGGRLGIGTNGFTVDSTRAVFLGANPTGGNATGTLSIKGMITTTFNQGFQNLSGATGDLVKQGGGTLALGGVSTYSGNTFLNNGTTQLVVNGTTSTGALPSTTVVNLGQTGSANTGILDLNGINQQVAGLNSVTGTANITTNAVTSSTGTATLTLGGSGTYAFGDGSATNSGIVSGTVAISKTGSGTQTLGGANTYSGRTAIAGGTLVIGSAGSINNSPLVQVTGTGALTLNNAAALSDTGTLSLVTGTTLNLSAASGSETIGALILDNNTEPAGTYTASQLTALDPNITFTGANETLTITPVPEPATVLGGVLLVGALGWNQRRRLRGLVAGRHLAA